MAFPSKGVRTQVAVRVSPEDRKMLSDQAKKAQMTQAEYVMALVRRDELDDTGTPVWAPVQLNDELPLAM